MLDMAVREKQGKVALLISLLDLLRADMWQFQVFGPGTGPVLAGTSEQVRRDVVEFRALRSFQSTKGVCVGR